jgi:hypothetical protein
MRQRDWDQTVNGRASSSVDARRCGAYPGPVVERKEERVVIADTRTALRLVADR